MACSISLAFMLIILCGTSFLLCSNFDAEMTISFRLVDFGLKKMVSLSFDFKIDSL